MMIVPPCSVSILFLSFAALVNDCQLFEQLARQSNEKRKIIVNESIPPSSTHSSESKTIEIESRKTKLVNVCPTRWVERHVAIETFSSLFPVVELLTTLM